MKLLTKHAQLIADLEKESEDDPEHVCCSCECLYQRKSVTRVKLSDNLSQDVAYTKAAHTRAKPCC